MEAETSNTVRASAEVFAALGALVDDGIPDLNDADLVFGTQRTYDFVANWGAAVRPEGAEVWNTQLCFGLRVDELTAMGATRGRLWAATQGFFSTHHVLVLATAQALPFDATLEYPDSINGRPVENYGQVPRSDRVPAFSAGLM